MSAFLYTSCCSYHFSNSSFGILITYLTRTVGTAVINEQDFKVGEGLGKEAIYATMQILLCLINGNYDAYLGIHFFKALVRKFMLSCLCLSRILSTCCQSIGDGSVNVSWETSLIRCSNPKGLNKDEKRVPPRDTLAIE